MPFTADNLLPGIIAFHFRPLDAHFRQNFLNRVGDSSVYRTVCWMLRWFTAQAPRHACGYALAKKARYQRPASLFYEARTGWTKDGKALLFSTGQGILANPRERNGELILIVLCI